MDLLHQKKLLLEQYLLSLGSIAVAFSAGVDSTFLLKTAHDLLGNRVLAVTAESCSFPAREMAEAAAFCKREQIAHVICRSEELQIEGFRKNPKNRCYLCKRELFTKIRAIADTRGLACIAEGSNLDDNGDYRPGLQAVAELGVKSPLRHAGLTKADIRALSREMGRPTWDKQSFACLSSRFVYGETISEERLHMVDLAEQYLLDLGFCQVRVRIHGEDAPIARIELAPSEFPKLLSGDIAAGIDRRFAQIGFAFVTLDLGGYRTGSMNKTLPL